MFSLLKCWTTRHLHCCVFLYCLACFKMCRFLSTSLTWHFIILINNYFKFHSNPCDYLDKHNKTAMHQSQQSQMGLSKSWLGVVLAATLVGMVLFVLSWWIVTENDRLLESTTTYNLSTGNCSPFVPKMDSDFFNRAKWTEPSPNIIFSCLVGYFTNVHYTSLFL